MSIPHKASFTKEGKPLIGKSKETVDLEFYFDSPTEWTQRIYPPMEVCFWGWAISLDKSPIDITITGAHSPPSTHHPKAFRPDVKEALKKLGKDVDDYCGFEFNLSFDKQFNREEKFIIEITNEKYSSGPIEFNAIPLTSIQWPTVESANEKFLGPRRSDYKSTWNALSNTEEEAKTHVIGTKKEEDFKNTGENSKNLLLNTVGINKDDVVLEIGCGVGRMASVLAPICKKWIGTDVSENMLGFARQRNRHRTNVEFYSVNGWDLTPISSESVDLVYCTVVFMHLEEWERYNYICEAKRILRTGGRLYVDNFNLCNEEGWKVFLQILRGSHPMDRPSHIGTFSTPDELRTYLERAGFKNIKQADSEEWIVTWGVKP